MEEKLLFQLTVDHFGFETQLFKAVEELAELQQAIIKYNLADIKTVKEKNLLHNLLEELVDVEIMIGQIKEIFNSPDELLLYENYKLDKQQRLEKLISNDGLE